MASRNGMADALRERILSGQLKPGEALPSSRQLIAQYGGGKETALAAVRILADEGLVSTGDRRRAVVRRPDEAVRTPEARLADAAVELKAVRAKVLDLQQQLADLDQQLVEALAKVST